MHAPYATHPSRRTSPARRGSPARRAARLSFPGFVLSAVLMLVVLLAALAVPAARAMPSGGPPSPPEYGRLGLSSDQMRQVRELQQEIHQRLRALESQLREQRQSLEKVYGEYELDVAKARQLNTRINETQQAILDQNLRLQTGLRRILTEEQFDRLKTMIEQRRQRMRDRMRNKPR